MAPPRVAEDRLTSGHRLSHPPPGDEVLITGIAGCFPESDSIKELQENLFNKVDVVTYDYRRWNLLNSEIPQRAGKINNLDKFDASFFGVDYKEAHTMDPVARILLEKTYEAIFDAGVNPTELRGSKLGVFGAITMSESEKNWTKDEMQYNGFGLTGCARAVTAARISRWLGVTGPSYTIDTACSTSLCVMDLAFRAIREGSCDSAIVCATNICLNPHVTMQYARAGVLSHDGKCKCFDDAANGYVRSEAIVVVFLQKAKNSRRAYARVVYTNNSCDGFKEQGIMFPSVDLQKIFFKEFYEECSVPPQSLEYCEVHGTGTAAGDAVELASVESIFCKDRTGPLRIGSIKSNIGHAEPAAGLCAIAKICIAYSSGYIAPNLHYKTSRKLIKSLTEKRLIVATDKTPCQRGMVGVNGFGFGGSNAHVLLSNFAKDKVNEGMPCDDLPRLVCVSGRTESAVTKIFNELESKTLDVEVVRLLHSFYDLDIEGHTVRGYTILGSTPAKSVSLARDVQYYSGVRRPVWFVYSGMDSMWASMASSLMKIPIFAEAIIKCHKVLEPKGINLTAILTEHDPKVYDSILNSFIGIAAIQIGLTDILKSVGIKPDNITGHGIGELGCAYAQGSSTIDETIRSAYSRGVAGMTTFAKDSIPKENTGSHQNTVQYEYDETSSQDHRDVIMVEIMPHGSQQTNHRNFVKDAFGISLVENDSKDNVLVLFNALGKMYEAGLNPHLANLYPHVSFPVSNETAMLSHLVEWDHRDNWSVALFKKETDGKYGERIVKIPLTDSRYEYLAFHNLDGRILCPATGYLVLVWESLGQMMGRIHTELSVVFENVRFLRASYITSNGSDLEFTITIHKESGDFEVMESGATVVTGKIYAEENVSRYYMKIPSSENVTIPNGQPTSILMKDLYGKEMTFKGFLHSGVFKNIQEWDFNNGTARISWDNNWVAFLDGLFQLWCVSWGSRALGIPTRIEKFSIDVHKHYSFTSKLDSNATDAGWIDTKLYRDSDIIQSGGVEIRGVHENYISKRPVPGVPVLEKREFVFNFGQKIRKVEDVLRIYIQLITEDILISKVKCIEFADDEYKKNKFKPLIKIAKDILGDMPLVQAELQIISKDKLKMPSSITVANKTLDGEKNCAVFIGANLLSRPEILQQALSTLRDKCFIISREKSLPDLQKLTDEYNIVCVYNTGAEYLVLFRRRIEPRPTKFIKIVSSDQSYAWIDEVKNGLKDSQKVVLYSQGEPSNGLLGLISCLRKELGSGTVYALFIADLSAPAFDPDLDFYKKQMDKDLAINIYQDGQWGTYRNFLLDDSETVLAYHAYVNTVTSGDLTSLRWMEGHLREDHVFTNPNDVLVHVYCAALNFRDVMIATGRLPVEAIARGRIAQECVQGIEIAGKTDDGARVMGMIPHSGLANLAVGFKPFLMAVPDQWTFEEAATVPVAYGTAFYAMVMVGRMQRGESILIHAGSGGVGQAAINVALHYGCEVFTTVGTQEKRAFIKKRFPQLKVSHIGNSRDTSFEEMIKRETNGKGVDLVLNSLSDDMLQASIRCLGSLGRFLEIGKFDISNNTPIDMEYFNKEISFHSIMLDYLFDDFDVKEIQKLQELITDGIKSRAVRPLTYSTYKKNEIETAYRYMGAGKHTGKVIIKIRDEDRKNLSAKPTYLPIQAMPRYTCYENHVYVLVGGLGGVGLEFADWLILRGAKKILLSSRHGVVNGYQALRIKIWKSYGVMVQISTDDITTEAGCEAMLNTANAMGPVEAIFNLAAVLKDALFQNQTPETFRTSFGPKARSTMHLDKLSQNMCPKLKEFVVFSSVSCNIGIAGQTNYGFSNSTIEKICEERKKLGLPGRALQWGAIGDVGIVENMQGQNIEGTFPQKISSCLLVLDQLMNEDAAVVCSVVVAEKKAGESTQRNVSEAVAQIMGIKDLKTVSQHVSLAELGMDSITAVEIKKTLEREFEVFLTSKDIRTITFPKLSGLKAKKEAVTVPNGRLLNESKK